VNPVPYFFFSITDQWEFQDPKMEVLYITVPYKGIFSRDIPLIFCQNKGCAALYRYSALAILSWWIGETVIIFPRF
jgi:hypothetical protein